MSQVGHFGPSAAERFTFAASLKVSCVEAWISQKICKQKTALQPKTEGLWISARLLAIMLTRPMATGIAILFCLLAGTYLGYQQGISDGRDQIIKIRLPSTPDEAALLGTRSELIEILVKNDPLERGALLAPKLQSLGPEALPQVLDAYNDVFFEIGDFEFEMLATWWARFDPQAALDYTRSYWAASNYSVPQAVIRQWASQDPRAAAFAAMSSGDLESSDPYIHSLVTGWDESGHPGLYEFIRNLGPGHPRQRALMQIAQRQVRRDGTESAIEWAEGLPGTGSKDATLKRNAFRRVASAVTEVDPEAGAAFSEKHFHSPFGQGVPERVGRRWVFYEPEATMDWLMTLPSGSNRDQAVEESYRSWSRRDAPSAMAWAAQKNLEEAWFQPALSVYARQVGQSDIQDGVALAIAVQNEDYRLLTIARVVRTWVRQDRVAALAWLKQSELSPQDQARILGLPFSKEEDSEKNSSNEEGS